jgi:opacity protein-like surface antigen
MIGTSMQANAVSYIAAEFGSAYSFKEGNSFINSFNKKINLNNNDYGKVYEWGMAIGSMLSENNSMEIAYNTRNKYSYDKYSIAIDDVTTASNQQLKILGKINNTSLIIFYNYDLLKMSRFALGINTGYGWSINKVTNLNEYLADNSLDAIIQSNKKRTNAFSFGVKLNITISNNFQLCAGYRYSNLGKFASGASAINPNTPELISPIQQITGNLKINEVYLRILFYFGS